MDDDLGALDGIAERLRGLEKDVSRRAAELGAPNVQREARATANAGTDAEGRQWAPTKDGTPPLQHAAGAVTAIVSGVTVGLITLVLRGYHVYHHRGVGKLGGKKKTEAKGKRGTPARPILPTGETLPASIRKAIADAARKAVAETMRGAT